MDKLDRIKVKKIIASLAKKYGLPTEVIQNITDSPYLFTYEKLKDLKLDNIKSEDEATQLKTNFNYKGFGKLYLNYPSLVARKNRQTNALKINNKQWKKQ